jgi:imidazolonepropionase-like amidohydrolase
MFYLNATRCDPAGYARFATDDPAMNAAAEDMLVAMVDEAARHGVRVAAHAHSKSGIELAIKCGVADIQHISFMDERLVDLAAKHECTVTPTSWVLQSLPTSAGLSDFVRDKAKRAAEVHAKAVDYARKGGLKILGGTDPVLPYMHGRNYMELVALMNGQSARRTCDRLSMLPSPARSPRVPLGQELVLSRSASRAELVRRLV